MKKLLSIIISLSILTGMMIFSVPVSNATEPKIEMSVDTLVVDDEGNFEAFTVTIYGAATYQSWIGIYDINAPQYPGNSQLHWCYCRGSRAVYSDAYMLPNEVVPDGYRITLTRKDLNPALSAKLVSGTYKLVLFYCDGAKGPDGAVNYENDDAYQELAYTTFKVQSSKQFVFPTAAKPTHTVANYWLNPGGSEFVTEFHAEVPFDGFNLVAWSSKPGYLVSEFYQGEELIYSSIETIEESTINEKYFADSEGNPISLPKGDYKWVLRALDPGDAPEGMEVPEDQYIVIPTNLVNEKFDNCVFSFFNDCDIEGEDGQEVICASFIIKTEETITATDFFIDKNPPTAAPTNTPAPATDTPTPTDTPAPTDTPVPTDTPAPTEEPKKSSGCSGFVGSSAVLALVSFTFMFIKRKE